MRWASGWLRVVLAAWLLVVVGAHAGEYLIGRGDSLKVTVYGEPELSVEVDVADGCTVTLGLVGRVDVCGRSVTAIEDEITGRYAGGFLVNPSVSVKVGRYHSQRVDVLGEVARPGPQYLERETSLVEVISLAGGARAENVVRVDIIGVDGATRSYALTDLSTSVMVSEGDKIVLRPGEVVYVEGQIKRPGAITLVERLTATRALAMAGGPDEYANLRRVLVNRADGSTVRVNVPRVHRGLEEDIVLLPDDHLIVPRSAL